MDPKAISRARVRLHVAEDALSRITAQGSYQEFAALWYQFLAAAKNVYTQLEMGAKISPQSKQWFGARKQERKDDPLLQYLFQARNADEHGISDTTKKHSAIIGIGGIGQCLKIDGQIIDSRGRINLSTVSSRTDEPVRFEFLPERVELLTVIGRGNVAYHPPTSHQGRPIDDPSPSGIARLGLIYLSALVADAEKLV